jgi:hypothetical protein
MQQVFRRRRVASVFTKSTELSSPYDGPQFFDFSSLGFTKSEKGSIMAVDTANLMTFLGTTLAWSIDGTVDIKTKLRNFYSQFSSSCFRSYQIVFASGPIVGKDTRAAGDFGISERNLVPRIFVLTTYLIIFA